VGRGNWMGRSGRFATVLHGQSANRHRRAAQLHVPSR
jgi:hypothetical protein